MITQPHEICTDGQANPVDCRHINILTVLSKLALAVVMGGAFAIVSVMS